MSSIIKMLTNIGAAIRQSSKKLLKFSRLLVLKSKDIYKCLSFYLVTFGENYKIWSTKPVSKSVFRDIMQQLIYPSILGVMVYSIFQNFSSFKSSPLQYVCIFLLLTQFTLDYICNVVSKNYKLINFIMDLPCLFLLNRSINYILDGNFKGASVCIGLIYAIFVVWDIIFIIKNPHFNITIATAILSSVVYFVFYLFPIPIWIFSLLLFGNSIRLFWLDYCELNESVKE